MLKIYTATQKHYNGTDVGVTMFTENNEMCFQSAFKIVNTEESEGHLSGIKRALSFMKNVRSTYNISDAVCIFSSEESRWVDLRIKEDGYIRNIRHMLGINLSTKEPTEEDKKNLMITQKQYLLMYKNLGNDGR